LSRKRVPLNQNECTADFRIGVPFEQNLQTRLGEEIGVSQQTISKYENGDENIPGDMLLALSKFFRVPIDYILRKEEEQQQREQNDRKEIMELYRDMDQYNRDTWIIIGKRLLGGQLHKYNENHIV